MRETTHQGVIRGHAPGPAHPDGDPFPPDRFTPERIARRRRIRMQAVIATGLSYGVDTAILALYAGIGTTTFRTPLLYALFAAIATLVAVVLFSTRLGETADDFFLSHWQVLMGTALQLGFLAYAPEVGLVFLTVLFIVFGFGGLRLSVKEAGALLSLATVGLVVVLPIVAHHSLIPLATPAERWVTAIAIAAALGRAVWLGLVGSKYRKVLSERSATLRQLTMSLEDQVAERTDALARANARLEELVAERTAEIQTLHGILPICSYCNKIRDDHGAWNQLETYISRRHQRPVQPRHLHPMHGPTLPRRPPLTPDLRA